MSDHLLELKSAVLEGLSLKIEDIHSFQVDLLAKGTFDVWIMWAFRCLKVKGATPLDVCRLTEHERFPTTCSVSKVVQMS